MLDPLVLKIVAVGFGLMFVLAAMHKLSALAQFRAILAAYEIMPVRMTTLAAVVLPVIEAVLGVAWLAAFRPPLVALLTAARLACYTLGMALNLKRGRVHIDCGCSMGGHAGRGQQLSRGLLVRNAALILAALLALLPAGERSIGTLDYLTLVASVVSLVFLYAAANQLLSNGAAIGVWRKRHD